MKQTVAAYMLKITDKVAGHFTLAPDAAAFTYQQLFEPQPDGVPLLLKVWGGPAQANAQLQEGFRSGVLRPADVTAGQLVLLQLLPSEEVAAAVAEQFCAKARTIVCGRRCNDTRSKAGHLVQMCLSVI